MATFRAMEAPEDDSSLLNAARNGDARALERLLGRYEAKVYRFGMKMCRHPEDAKDVLQDTLLTMARSVRDFRGASSLSTWLYTIARSACIKKRRKGRFAPSHEESLDTVAEEAPHLADPSRPADEDLVARETRRALDRAIAELVPTYREVLVLRDVEGLTAREVGDVLGLSVEAVKSRLHRARLAVRARVAPVLGITDEPAARGGNCPDVLLLFSRHLEVEIEPGVCAQMEQHLAACSRCRGACVSLQRTLALCRDAPVSRVPRSVQESVRHAIRDFLQES